jgi:hypothetical protein
MIIQGCLDKFKKYWNTHRICAQKAKYLPSGDSPMEVFKLPENFGLKHAGIPVDLEYVRKLREPLPKTREECYRWVSDEFDALATEGVYQLGCSKQKLTTGWSIYSKMLAILEALLTITT